MINFSELNPMQQRAVMKKDGPVLVLAGAGSGKTGALTVRIAELLKSGVRPWNIMAITFTNKAAKEMKERVTAIVGDEAENIWISTFHSSCVRILRRDINHIGFDRNFSIYDESDKEKVIKECYKQLNISLTDKFLPVKGVMAEISRQKDELIGWEDYKKDAGGDIRKQKIADIYRVYQERLHSNNALDFDDLIYKTVQLFRTCPDVLDYYSEKFRYIMVDEYQDTNTAQYTLVRLIASKYGNICVVGDDDQSIYGWRGANIRNILDFEKDFPGAEVIKLEQNYRSTQTILDAANAVIKNNESRKAKALWTTNEKGEKITVYRTENEYDEARYIAQKIESLIMQGQEYGDFAVLYRTNAQSRLIEEFFIKNNIPYRLYGGVRFYDRKEIKDVIAYLKAINNPNDDIALRRIINVPKRGIGDSSVDKVSVFAAQNGISLYSALSKLGQIEGLGARSGKLAAFFSVMESLKETAETESLSDIIDMVLDKSGYLESLKAEGTEEADMRIENIDEFVSKAVEYEKENPEGGLSGFLEDVALIADIDEASKDEGGNTVALMTLHSAKGLEFPYVFISGMEEGMFPSQRSIMTEDERGVEEERRLCYVGITRAQQKLFLTMAKSRMQHGMTNYNQPSRFLKEIPNELLDMPSNNVPKKDYTVSKTVVTMGRKKSFDKPKPYSMGTLNQDILKPKNIDFDLTEGDKVRAPKYGIGTVTDIKNAGADYEVSVDFGDKGTKKFMYALSKLKKV